MLARYGFVRREVGGYDVVRYAWDESKHPRDGEGRFADRPSPREQAEAHRRKKGSANVLDPKTGKARPTPYEPRSHHEARARAIANRISARAYALAQSAGMEKFARMRGDKAEAARLRKSAKRAKALKARLEAFKERSGLTIAGKPVPFGRVVRPGTSP